MESATSWSNPLPLSSLPSPSHSRHPSAFKFMAFSTLHTFSLPSLSSPSSFHPFPLSSLSPKPTSFNPRPLFPRTMHASRIQDAVGGALALVQSSPATWQSALLSNALIFFLGSPILVSGLSLSGIGAAFLLGTLTWRAFGPSGFFLVATYFVIVSSVFLCY